MDFLTALKKAQGAFSAMSSGGAQDFSFSFSDVGIWVRPKSWRGLQALAPKYDAPQSFELVPSHRGGQTAYLPTLKELSEEWEVITPGEFYQESQRGQGGARV